LPQPFAKTQPLSASRLWRQVTIRHPSKPRSPSKAISRGSNADPDLLSRNVKGSANRLKAEAKRARLHARIANLRSDVLRQLTTDLVNRFGVIGSEDLHVRGMMTSRMARAADRPLLLEV
jgi:hypothetical protein